MVQILRTLLRCGFTAIGEIFAAKNMAFRISGFSGKIYAAILRTWGENVSVGFFPVGKKIRPSGRLRRPFGGRELTFPHGFGG
jgi:hypothetical protein